MDTIRQRPVEAAVLDPMFGGVPRTREIERIRLLFPSLPVLLYTTLSPETASVLLDLGRIGIRRVLFTRFDDSPAALRAALRDELAESASHKVIRSLEEALQVLPGKVRTPLESMLYAPPDATSVGALADRMDVADRAGDQGARTDWEERLQMPDLQQRVARARLFPRDLAGRHAHDVTVPSNASPMRPSISRRVRLSSTDSQQRSR